MAKGNNAEVVLQKCHDLLNVVEAMTKEHSELQEQFEALQEHNGKMQARITELQEQVQQLNVENDQLRKQLDDATYKDVRYDVCYESFKGERMQDLEDGHRHEYYDHLCVITNGLNEMARAAGRKDTNDNQLLRECYNLIVDYDNGTLLTDKGWAQRHFKLRTGQHGYLFWTMQSLNRTPEERNESDVMLLFCKDQVEPLSETLFDRKETQNEIYRRESRRVS